MIPTWLAVAGAAATIASVVLSFYLAGRKARQEAREATRSRATSDALVISKLDGLAEQMDGQESRLKAVAVDVAELKTRVAIQEDRWSRPLRAVRGE